MTEGQVARGAVRIDALENAIGFLTDSICAGRATGTRGGIETGMWIERRMKSQGLLPLSGNYAHSFRSKAGAVGRNIMGLFPANGSYPSSRYIVVMANFDGLGILKGTLYPGADTNASGVAALLSLGDMLKQMTSLGKKYSTSIIFVAVDSRQQGMSGSEFMLREIRNGTLKDPSSGRVIRQENISLVVTLDQVGSTLSPIHKTRPDYLIMLGGDTRLNSFAESSNAIKEIKLDLGLDYYGSRDFTRMMYRTMGDQKTFVEGGFPTVVFTSGITMLNNKSGDTLSTLDLPVLRKRIWLIFHFLERVA